MEFKLVSEFSPTGDQPQAIEALTSALRGPGRHNTLMGVTGSGKTFTVANVVQNLQRPTIILSHNKTLAYQLYTEFRHFFPDNAVEYFVSYYDYYQPEAYLPKSDTYIEKDLSINEEIEKLRLHTTSSLLSGRRDVIVVSSVSCLYGIGNPEDFHTMSVRLNRGQAIPLQKLLYSLVEALYTRTEADLKPATFRLSGDTLDVCLPFGDLCYRIGFYYDEIEDLAVIDPASGRRLESVDTITLFPANLFVTTRERTVAAIAQIQLDLGKHIGFFESQGRYKEAEQIKRRVEYDLEMIKELGYCSGIENYSRYFDGRAPGSRPFCLLDYFPEDYLMVIDESHVSLPQIRAMYGGDKARKENLVEYGFRLPAAIDNRPLTFAEFESLAGQTLYVSATPSDYELIKSEGVVVEQIIRPTGLLDPPMALHPTTDQIDDLTEEIYARTSKGERILVVTLTKRMAEELSKYFDRRGVRSRYIHSDVETLERAKILDDLRAGSFDVLIGVNLLREGLDLPEVSLVAIMDADKEGFLRNARSLTQTAGRAARHASGAVILYADKVTDSMRKAIRESNYRRDRQATYNNLHRMTPRAAVKNIPRLADNAALYPIAAPGHAIAADVTGSYDTGAANEAMVSDLCRHIDEERGKMLAASDALDFGTAVVHRDRMYELQSRLRELTAEDVTVSTKSQS